MKILSGMLTLFILSVGVTFTYAAEDSAKQLPLVPVLPNSEFTQVFERSDCKSITNPWFSPGVFLITAGAPGNYNSMTGGWGSFGILWRKPVANIYVKTTRHTCSFLDKETLFTLSWYPDSERDAVFGVYGHQSGRDTNKEKMTGFKPVMTPEGAITYLQADRVLVCRRLVRVPLTKDIIPAEHAKDVNDKQFYVQFTGEVISVWQKRSAK